MIWKKRLRILEKAEKFQEAITFMERVVAEDPDDVDKYIFMLYLLVDFIQEPHIGNFEYTKHDIHWQDLAKKYLSESYIKFTSHPEKSVRCDYLYYVGHICVTGNYICGMNDDDLPSQMIAQAKADDPDNPVYRMGDTGDKEVAQMMFNPESSLRKMIAEKGSVGANLLGIFSSWAQQETGRWSEEDTAILRAASLA
jgi:hypothetical protein